MGLFDSIAGAVMGELSGGDNDQLVKVAMNLLNEHGGLQGVLDKLKEGGLGEQVASWVGTGANLPISAEQITQALGSGPLAEMASKFGISPETLGTQLAQNLPNLVDKLTPNNQVPTETSAILGQLMGMLKS